MLHTIFLICAVIGGTVLVCQFVLTLIGLGGEGADFDGHAGGDLHVGADAGHGHHGTDWLFGVLSFRSVVAFLAFFGLAGYGSLGAGQTQPISLGIALVIGGAAMFGIYLLMRGISKLQDEGTRQINNAIGQRGSVLVPVPPNSSGVGKVHVSMQGRLEELSAMTEAAERLATGTPIEVVEVMGPQTVLVAPIIQEAHDAAGQDSVTETES
ncbi:MAG: hypothetical protein WBF93_13770 [Pirellulales bacterium]